jgi:hypothetical protein
LIPAKDPDAHARQLNNLKREGRQSEAEAAKPPSAQSIAPTPKVRIPTVTTPFVPAS